MSAIIAGKKCKKCNNDYWITFGHPKWFSNTESKEFENFIKLRKQGKCLKCLLLSEANTLMLKDLGFRGN